MGMRTLTPQSLSVCFRPIALSSGEAELYAGVSAMSRAIGLKQTLSDWGVNVRIKINADASASLSMQERIGLGKAKHINTQYMWVQALVADGTVKLYKVPGEDNSADLMTKHLSGPKITHLLRRMGYRLVEKIPNRPGTRRAAEPAAT